MRRWSKILETWGEGNVWSEIQLALAGRQGKVLDIACGTGKTMQILGVEPGLELWGCDISDRLIDRAVLRGIACDRLYVGDATELPYLDGFFDYSYSIGSIEHFTEAGIANVLKECRRSPAPSPSIPTRCRAVATTRVGSPPSRATSTTPRNGGWTNIARHSAACESSIRSGKTIGLVENGSFAVEFAASSMSVKARMVALLHLFSSPPTALKGLYDDWESRVQKQWQLRNDRDP